MTMDRPVRIGVLGGGGIFGAHAPGFKAAGEACDVVAVAEPQADRHERIRQLAGNDVRIVSDYHDVLAMDEVDAVDILLPHHLHEAATMAAAQAGKPVLIEKVMARNVAECDRMIDACDRAGVTLTIAHDRRYGGVWEAMKKLLDTGALGDVFYWKLEHNQNVLFPPGHWGRTAEGLGGGAIMSCLTHQIDALRWYGGEAEAVTCISTVLPERMEGETVGVVAVRMRSSAVANLSINWFTNSHIGQDDLCYEMVQACGRRGEAYFTSNRGELRVRLHEPLATPTDMFDTEAALERFVAVPHDDTPGHVGCIRQWVRLLRGEPADIRTSGRDCRGTVELAEAAYRSERTGRVISLPLT